MQANRELVGHEAATACRLPIRVHRALDPTKDLEGLESGLEQPCARALHEALEEALHA